MWDPKIMPLLRHVLPGVVPSFRDGTSFNLVTFPNALFHISLLSSTAKLHGWKTRMMFLLSFSTYIQVFFGWDISELSQWQISVSWTLFFFITLFITFFTATYCLACPNAIVVIDVQCDSHHLILQFIKTLGADQSYSCLFLIIPLSFE